MNCNKAFENVKHSKLIQILQEIGLDSKDVRLTENLYWNQSVCVRVDEKTSNVYEIHKVVREGCILSSVLFNLYNEFIFKETLH